MPTLVVAAKKNQKLSKELLQASFILINISQFAESKKKKSHHRLMTTQRASQIWICVKPFNGQRTGIQRAVAHPTESSCKSNAETPKSSSKNVARSLV